jgi:hypothetical protein
MLPSVGMDTLPAVGLVVGGFVVALVGGNSPRFDQVRRYRSFVFDQKPAPLTGPAPAQISITAVLSCIRLDLGGTEFPPMSTVQLDITLFGGRVEIVVPAGWTVTAGRIHARGVGYEGTLDLSLLTPEQHEQRRAVVNVLGWWGAVQLSAHRRGRPARRRGARRPGPRQAAPGQGT